jgi:hypothetical protein
MHRLFEELKQQVLQATEGMQDSDFLKHPDGKWNSAEILEHLTLAFSGTVKGCEKCLLENKTITSNPTLKQRLASLVLVECGYFPSGRQAPKHVIPSGSTTVKDPVRGLFSQLQAMDTALTECETRFGSVVSVMNHPILGPFNIRQWRKFHLVHTKHHMKQINTLRS